MKRWLVVLLVLLAVLILVSPGIVGRLAERNIEQNIEWAEEDDAGVSVETESFDRGWFTSAGRYRVEFDGLRFRGAREQYQRATGQPGLPALIIETRLEHGPLPGGAPALAASVSSFALDTGNGDPVPVPGALHTRVGLSGTSTSQLLLEPGGVDLDGVRLEWQGTDLTFVADPSDGALSVEGLVKPWQASIGSTEVGAQGINVSARQVKSGYGFNVGSIEFSTGEITSRDSGTSVSVDSVTLQVNSAIDGDRLDAESRFSLAALSAPGYGEASVELDFVLHGADAASVAVLSDALQQAGDADDPAAALAELYPQIEDEVATLFGRGFGLELRQLDLALPQGTMAADLKIEVAGSAANADFDWASALLATTASLNLRMSGAVYEMLAAMNPQAGALLAMGILKPDGQDFVMEARYAQGLVNINGAPLPIPMPRR